MIIATRMIRRLQKMPRKEVNPSHFIGRNCRGARIHPHNTFNATGLGPSIRDPRVSANRIINPTQATISSRDIKELIVTLPTSPNATNAISAKLAKDVSTSRHFASRPAVYLLTIAERNRPDSPIIQPAYLMPSGRLKMPTPTRTFDELNIV
jgi:hypothetical protein